MKQQTKTTPTRATQNNCLVDDLIDALEALLAMWWSSELADYRAAPRENHIFLKLEVVRHWLDRMEEGF